MQRETQIVQDYADVSLCPHSRTGSVDTAVQKIKLFIGITLPNLILIRLFFALFHCVASWKLKWFHGNDPNDCYLCYVFH